MARILVTTPTSTFRAVLPASTLVGRHWRCDVQVDVAGVPHHWVEIRWSGGTWAWRALGAAGQTTGRGTTMPHGWRSLDLGTRIRLTTSDVTLHLKDDGAPALILQQVESGTFLDGDERFDIVTLGEDGVFQLDTEGEPMGEALSDGMLIVHNGQQWRVHLAQPATSTWNGRVSLEDPDLSLDFDLRELQVTMSTPRGEATLKGALVRPFAVYAHAVDRDRTNGYGGWLSNIDAQIAVMSLGTEMEVGPERMNWDRHRLRSALVELGITDVSNLFERKKVGAHWVHRLGLRPAVSGLDKLDQAGNTTANSTD